MKFSIIICALGLVGFAGAQTFQAMYRNMDSTPGTGGSANIYNYFAQGPSEGSPTTTRIAADDITFAAGSAGKSVTRIIWSVYNSTSTDITARINLFFWDSDGTDGDPGTFLGNGPLSPQPLQHQAITYFALTIPENIFVVPTSERIWAGMSFDNGGGATASNSDIDSLGQVVAGPPDVGSSADVFYETDSGGPYAGSNNPVGLEYDFGGAPVANFEWEFDTTTQVPEPASIAMLGLGVLAMVRRRRVKKS